MNKFKEINDHEVNKEYKKKQNLLRAASDAIFKANDILQKLISNLSVDSSEQNTLSQIEFNIKINRVGNRFQSIVKYKVI